jgi:hypothetical protein
MKERKTFTSGIAAKGAERVLGRTSRRGFVAKTGAAVIAFGMGDFLLANAASAAPGCCTGTQCSSCPGTCPDTNACPSGHTWTGYKWTCCGGAQIYYCRDCRNNNTGVICVCGCHGSQPCNAPAVRNRTATELSQDAMRRQRVEIAKNT